MNRLRLFVPAALLLLTACASQSNQPAPIVDRYQQGSPAVVSAPAPAVVTYGPIVSTTGANANKANTYVVQKGDGLYRIAQDHGVSYRDLAAWNNLDDLNSIKVGQVLRLTPPGGAVGSTNSTETYGVEVRPLRDNTPAVAQTTTPAPAAVVQAPAAGVIVQTPPAGAVVNKSYPKALKLPWTAQNEAAITALAEGTSVASKPQADIVKPTKPVAAAASETAAEAWVKSPAKPVPQPVASDVAADNDTVDWIWPTVGRSTKSFTEESRGIDIAGKMGQSVIASASGKVVYAGGGLRGYGKMIIIKHNAEFLSAYAHNSKLLVKEGDIVKKGEKIAEMGNTDADQVKLHFEIRRLGKPVDPAKYIHSDKS